MDADRHVGQPTDSILVVLIHVALSVESAPHPQVENKSTEKTDA